MRRPTPTHVLLTLEELDERINIAVAEALNGAIDTIVEGVRKFLPAPQFLDRAGLARHFGVDVSDIDLECRRGMPHFNIEGSSTNPWFDVRKCLDWCATPLGSRTPYLRLIPTPSDASETGDEGRLQ